MKQPDFPPRLSESSSDARVVTTLEIAKSYEPPAARTERALARMRATRVSGALPGRRLRVGDHRRIVSMKVAALSALVLAIGAGWTVYRSAEKEPSPPPAITVPGDATSAESRSTEPGPASPADATMRVEELPTATATPARMTPERSMDKPPARPSSNLARDTAFDDELALVESARASLAKGDAAACLTQLERYDRQVHGGVFSHEVAVMRIEALIARGEATRARALGKAFLAESPASAYADRIRSLLSRIPARPTEAP